MIFLELKKKNSNFIIFVNIIDHNIVLTKYIFNYNKFDLGYIK